MQSDEALERVLDREGSGWWARFAVGRQAVRIRVWIFISFLA
jgi:hypothetical protein